VHLGTPARYLRLLGFDTRFGNDLDDDELAELTSREKRILLKRDVGLLKRKVVERGHWLRSRDPERQVEEVVAALHLQRALKPFTRCMACNPLRWGVAWFIQGKSMATLASITLLSGARERIGGTGLTLCA